MRHLRLLLIGALCALLLTGNTYGDIISVIDFEDGRTGSADKHPDLSNSGNSPEIVTAENGVKPRSGKYMMKTYLNRKTSSTNYRTEVSLKAPSAFEKGKEYWLGFSVYLPADWDMNYGGESSRGMVFQFHGRPYNSPDGSWRKIQPLLAWHTENGWEIRNLNYSKSSPNKTRGLGNLETFSKVVPYRLGAWNDFVINVKFSGAKSPDDEDGFMRVWINDEKVLDRVGQNYFGEEPQGPFFKMGLYAASWQYPDSWKGPDSRTLYHDELRVGGKNSSYSEVAPAGKAPAATNVPPSPPTNLQVE